MSRVQPRKVSRSKANARSQEQTLRTNDRAPTTKEIAELTKFKARYEDTPSVKLRTSTEIPGKLEVQYDDEAIGLAILMNAIGTADLDFYNGLISQLRRVNSSQGEIDKGSLDFMLSFIKSVKPESEIVAMHASADGRCPPRGYDSRASPRCFREHR